MDKIKFEHLPDPAWIYVERVGVWVYIAGIIFLLLTLCFWYLKKEGPYAKMGWKMRKALNVGIFFFPMLGCLIGLMVAIKASTKVELCYSCHKSMGSYVENMVNPANKSLAAKHFKNLLINEDQCYKCHSGYGIGGTLKSKLDGLRHTIKYYTNSYDEDIEMPEMFPNQNCLDCHDRIAVYSNSGRHKEFAKDLASEKIYCYKSECHENVHEEP